MSFPNEQYFPPSQAKEFDQPRFYNSPMVVQQPFLQMLGHQQSQQAPPPHHPPNYVNQSIIYPSQQQFYEPIPVNNYLLIPQQNGSNLYNQNFVPIPMVQQIQQQPQQQQQQQQPQTQAQQPPPSQAPPPPSQPPKQQQPQPLVGAPAPPQQMHIQHHQSPGQGPARTKGVLYSNFTERLQELLPLPPLSKAPTRPDVNYNSNQKRAKRKSKFTKKQDELIVSLKRKGKSWVEIAEITQVGSYLAARNRYQVIVGQQGNNNSSSWSSEDKVLLRNLLDQAELEKWNFIANEFNKATGKNYSDKECRDFIRQLFWMNPALFQVNEDTITECSKEKKITEKALEQHDKHDAASSSPSLHSESQYADSLLKKNYQYDRRYY